MLNNKNNLENQQIGWLEEQLSQHYKKQPLRAKKAGDRYWEQFLNTLGNKENTIHLWELDYGQIFKDFPIEVSPHLSIDDLELSGAEKEKFEKAVKEKVLQMMEAIKEESGYTWNLVAIICCAQGKEKLYDGKSNWYYYILQGEPFETGNGSYDWKLFEAYEGVFGNDGRMILNNGSDFNLHIR